MRDGLMGLSPGIVCAACGTKVDDLHPFCGPCRESLEAYGGEASRAPRERPEFPDRPLSAGELREFRKAHGNGYGHWKAGAANG